MAWNLIYFKSINCQIVRIKFLARFIIACFIVGVKTTELLGFSFVS